jgi:ribonuclease HI
MKRVVIYSDGACKGNPGPGGWAAVLRFNGAEKEISGGVPATTNNRMELQGAVEALKILKESCLVSFYTDSSYLRNGVTKWIAQWLDRDWMTRGSQTVKNQDLWKELYFAAQRHRVTWFWTRGHSTNPDNNRCDRLARGEIAKINREFGDRELAEKLSLFLRDNWRSQDNRSKPIDKVADICIETSGLTEANGCPPTDGAS